MPPVVTPAVSCPSHTCLVQVLKPRACRVVAVPRDVAKQVHKVALPAPLRLAALLMPALLGEAHVLLVKASMQLFELRMCIGDGLFTGAKHRA